MKKVSKLKKQTIYDNIVFQLLPFIVFVGMIVAIVIMKRASLRTFWIAAFFGLCTAFFTYKDKKGFSKKCVENMHNNSLSMCLLIFLLSGILSNILKTSGLSNSLISVFYSLGVDSRFLIVAFFIICCIISTICGTSTGTISFAVPLFVPLAITGNLNIYMTLGAIAAGSFFGDHLSPISDTTILSVNGTGCDMYKMMKQRIIIALIVFLISCGIYVALGLSLSTETTSFTSIDASLKPLFLLVIPIFMLIMLRRNRDVVKCLLISDLFAIVLALILGLTSFDVVFSSTSPIIAGFEGVIGVTIFLIILFTLVGFIPQKTIDSLIDKMVKNVKSPFLSNLISLLILVLFMLGVSNNTAAMSIEGCFISKLFKNKTPEEKANIFDAVSVGISGVLPYNTAFMLMISLAFDNGVVQDGFKIMNVPIYSISCILFIVIYFVIALKGNRKKLKKA